MCVWHTMLRQGRGRGFHRDKYSNRRASAAAFHHFPLPLPACSEQSIVHCVLPGNLSPSLRRASCFRGACVEPSPDPFLVRGSLQFILVQPPASSLPFPFLIPFSSFCFRLFLFFSLPLSPSVVASPPVTSLPSHRPLYPIARSRTVYCVAVVDIQWSSTLLCASPLSLSLVVALPVGLLAA